MRQFFLKVPKGPYLPVSHIQTHTHTQKKKENTKPAPPRLINIQHVDLDNDFHLTNDQPHAHTHLIYEVCVCIYVCVGVLQWILSNKFNWAPEDRKRGSVVGEGLCKNKCSSDTLNFTLDVNKVTCRGRDLSCLPIGAQLKLCGPMTAPEAATNQRGKNSPFVHGNPCSAQTEAHVTGTCTVLCRDLNNLEETQRPSEIENSQYVPNTWTHGGVWKTASVLRPELVALFLTDTMKKAALHGNKDSYPPVLSHRGASDQGLPLFTATSKLLQSFWGCFLWFVSLGGKWTSD